MTWWCLNDLNLGDNARDFFCLFCFYFFWCLKMMTFFGSIIQYILQLFLELVININISILLLYTLTYFGYFLMIPRTVNPLISQHLKAPSSPKFGNSYGIQSNHTQRQNLIDQIINNCQRAQSPLNTGRNSCQSSRNASFRTQLRQDKQKQNLAHFQSPNPVERHSIGKRQSFQQQKYNVPRPSTQYLKEKRSTTSNNCYPFLNLEQQRSQEEYFPKIVKQCTSPPYKMRTNLEIPKSKRHNSTDKKTSQGQELQSQNKFLDQQKFTKKIQEERIKHIQHCKREARKLRLYYVELQNKLCEVRNKELKILAEYEQSKLKEYDNCLRNLNDEQKNINLEEFATKIEDINKGPIAKVNQAIKPDIQGCLFTGVSGIYFSFDQKI